MNGVSVLPSEYLKFQFAVKPLNPLSSQVHSDWSTPRTPADVQKPRERAAPAVCVRLNDVREQKADFTASLSERAAESHISVTPAGVSAQLRRESQIILCSQHFRGAL